MRSSLRIKDFLFISWFFIAGLTLGNLFLILAVSFSNPLAFLIAIVSYGTGIAFSITAKVKINRMNKAESIQREYEANNPEKEPLKTPEKQGLKPQEETEDDLELEGEYE